MDLHHFYCLAPVGILSAEEIDDPGLRALFGFNDL